MDAPGHALGALTEDGNINIGLDGEYANAPVVNADWGGRGCRVVGCTEDIYSQRPVNLKYRLCRTHKAADVLIVNGLPKRFCSQCSTFKHVCEFKGKMRACRPCLTHRSSNRYLKRDFVGTLMPENPNQARRAQGNNLLPEQQQNGSQLSPAAILESAQIEAFMAGAALAEMLRSNGDTQPYATAAAMASAAVGRGTRQHHQQQQQQNLLEQQQEPPPTLLPPPRIISSTTANNNTADQTDLQPANLNPETIQQERALAALLTAASMGTAPTTTTTDPLNTELPGRNDAYTSYHPQQTGREQALLSLETHHHMQQLQQSAPGVSLPLFTPPNFQSLVEAHHNREPTLSLPEQSPTAISRGLVLKRQRVLAELHLAQTNLELAEVEEDIYRLRNKIQQQQLAAGAADNGGGKSIEGLEGMNSSFNLYVDAAPAALPAAAPERQQSDQIPATPSYRQ